jgi:ribonuclease D
MEVITTTSALQSFCERANQAPFCAVDTEFMRETTYWANLCLVQIAFEGGEAIIDPLAPGLSLEPLFVVLRNPAVLKVFHAARQDVEIFHNLMGELPSSIFDTQIAAMAIGLGDSIAYDALVQALLKTSVDKSSRFTDWSKRPLNQDQLTYALGDVTHLRDLFPKMREKLDSLGRAEWLEDELSSLLHPDNYDTAPENAWKRLKLRRHTPEYLAVLAASAGWRERTAQDKNVPRGRVAKDDALYEIAEQKPKSPEAMDRLRAVPKGFGRSTAGQDLIRVILDALADPARYAPEVERPKGRPPSTGSTVELLKVLLRVVSERHGVAPRLIANVSDLEEIASDDFADVAALSGWRFDVFGKMARELKAGQIGLALNRGRVDVIELRETVEG